MSEWLNLISQANTIIKLKYREIVSKKKNIYIYIGKFSFYILHVM